MDLYQDCHIFIDESGTIAARSRKNQRELWLVGGVLLYGDFDDAADGDLWRRMQQAVEGVKGKFPADLHAGDKSLSISNEQQEELLRNLTTVFKDWNGQAREAVGVGILHTADVFPGLDRLFSEDAGDNRYMRLLISLIEHLFLVETSASSKLAPGARVHLHVASRRYVFEPNPAAEEQLSRLGYQVESFARDGKPMRAINWIINSRSLLAMLQSLFWHRWPTPCFHFDSIDLPSLKYQGDRQCAAALYLADVYLHALKVAVYKSGFLKRADKGPVRLRTDVVPTDQVVHYGPGLELLAIMAGSLAQGNLAAYEDARSTYPGKAAETGFPRSYYASLESRLEEHATSLRKKCPELLVEAMEEACLEVDKPLHQQSGLAAARRSYYALRELGNVPLRAEALWLQTQLSAANHTGNSEEAKRVWDDFGRFSPQLSGLGSEGLRLWIEITNRYAVALMDRFQSDQARQTLEGVIDLKEGIVQTLQNVFPQAAGWSDYELGACFGSLGQCYALSGQQMDCEKAVACFRRAITFFQKPWDIDRQWNAIAHVACDLEKGGRLLWDEAVSHLGFDLRTPPILDDERPYHLALQIKGLWRFGTDGEVDAFLESWGKSCPEPLATALHPYGLIDQGIGMLLARRAAPRQAKDLREVEEWFDAASRAMGTGMPILELLGRGAQLRKYVALSRLDNPARYREPLIRALSEFKGCLMYKFGPVGYDQPPGGPPAGRFGCLVRGLSQPLEIAEALLGGIRFNYW